MASMLIPQPAAVSSYRGVGAIYEYTNHDGALTAWNCGQAAAATFLTHHGFMEPIDPAKNMAWLEEHHPPDQLFGWFGTGRKRVERMMRAFHLDLIEVHGTADLREHLERDNPVILMLAMSSGKLLGFDLPGGHWVVAFGHDGDKVHLTNNIPMSWTEIDASWHGITPRWLRMNQRGLALRLPEIPV